MTSITNSESGTNITEIADGIYLINTPVPPRSFAGGFSFNQFPVDDDSHPLRALADSYMKQAEG